MGKYRVCATVVARSAGKARNPEKMIKSDLSQFWTESCLKNPLYFFQTQLVFFFYKLKKLKMSQTESADSGQIDGRG